MGRVQNLDTMLEELGELLVHVPEHWAGRDGVNLPHTLLWRRVYRMTKRVAQTKSRHRLGRIAKSSR